MKSLNAKSKVAGTEWGQEGSRERASLNWKRLEGAGERRRVQKGTGKEVCRGKSVGGGGSPTHLPHLPSPGMESQVIQTPWGESEKTARHFDW